MDKQTKEAIQEIGKLAKGTGETFKAIGWVILIIELFIIGLFVIFIGIPWIVEELRCEDNEVWAFDECVEISYVDVEAQPILTKETSWIICGIYNGSNFIGRGDFENWEDVLSYQKVTNYTVEHCRRY